MLEFNKAAAFSLIEMLMVFVLLFVFLAAATPFMRFLFSENAVQATAFALGSALDLARQTAIIQGLKVKVCPSSNNQECGDLWRDSFIVITSKNEVVYNWLSRQSSIIWNSSAGDDGSVEFLPTGFTNGQRGTFYICAANQNFAISKTIVVISTGRWSMRQMSLQDWQRFCKYPQF